MDEQLKKLVGKRVIVSNLIFHIEGTLQDLGHRKDLGSLFQVKIEGWNAKGFVHFYSHEVTEIVRFHISVKAGQGMGE